VTVVAVHCRIYEVVCREVDKGLSLEIRSLARLGADREQITCKGSPIRLFMRM